MFIYGICYSIFTYIFLTANISLYVPLFFFVVRKKKKKGKSFSERIKDFINSAAKKENIKYYYAYTKKKIKIKKSINSLTFVKRKYNQK